VSLEAVVVVSDGSHEEAHRLGGIARTPFLAGLFELNAGCGIG
jgi:hypothetical protein